MLSMDVYCYEIRDGCVSGAFEVCLPYDSRAFEVRVRCVSGAFQVTLRLCLDSGLGILWHGMAR